MARTKLREHGYTEGLSWRQLAIMGAAGPIPLTRRDPKTGEIVPSGFFPAGGTDVVDEAGDPINFYEERRALLEDRKLFDNPLLDMDEAEAMEYVATAGMSDSVRGIAQMIYKGIGYEKGLKKLQEYDNDLYRIFQNPEYGSKAIGNFIISAIVRDPVNLIPIASIATKANTLRKTVNLTLNPAVKTILRKAVPSKGIVERGIHGATLAAGFSALGYVNEERPGLFGETQSRMENVYVGAAFGGTIGSAVGVFSRLAGKRNPMRGREEISVKGFNPNKLDESELRYLDDWKLRDEDGIADVLVAGRRIQTKDGKIVGRIQEYNLKTRHYIIEQIVNVETGEVKILKVPRERIHGWYGATPPTNRTRPIQTIDTEASRWTVSEEKTVYKLKDHQIVSRKENFSYNKLDTDTGITYRVQRVEDSKVTKTVNSAGKEVPLEMWQVLKMKDGKVLSEVFHPQHLKRSYMRRFLSRKSAQDNVENIIKREAAEKAKTLFNNRGGDASLEAAQIGLEAEKRGQNARTAANKHLDQRVKEEIVNESNDGWSSIDSVVDLYRTLAGDKIFGLLQKNWGTSILSTAGAIGGYNAIEDPNAPMYQKIIAATLLAAGGAGLARSGHMLKAKHFGLVEGDERLSEYLSSRLLNDYGLHPEFVKSIKQRQIDIRRIQQEFSDVLGKYQEVITGDMSKLVHSFMTGRLDIIDELSTAGLKLNDEARTVITKYAQELVQLGMLPEKVFQKNINEYLHRSYLKHEMGGYKNFISDLQKLSFDASEMRPRGYIHPAPIFFKTFNDPNKKWQREGFTILKDKRTDAQKKAGTGKVSVRRNWTPEELKENQYIEDIGYALAETGRLLATDVATARFFKFISEAQDELGNRLFVLTKSEFAQQSKDVKSLYRLVPTTIVEGTEKGISVKRYGRLASYPVVNKKGKVVYEPLYIKNEVLDRLDTLVGFQKDLKDGLLMRKIEQITRGWKFLKTAGALAVHTNNTVSNFAVIALSDTPTSYVGKAIKEFRKNYKIKGGLWVRKSSHERTPIYRLAETQGIFNSDQVTNEFNLGYGTILEEELAKIKNEADIVGMFKFTDNVKDYIKKAWGYTGGALIKHTAKLYQVEDHMFRMGVFMHGVEEAGGIHKVTKDQLFEITDHAKKMFVDYDINAPWIDKARKSAIPFISYAYGIIPSLAERAVQNPHKVAVLAAVGFAVTDIGRKIAGGDEDIERLTMRDQFSKRVWNLPFMPYTMMRMPWNSKDGKSVYLDISRLVPGGDIFEQGERGVPGIPNAFQPSFGFWGDLYNTFVARKDTYTGEEIEGIETDDYALLNDLIRKLTPNNLFIPGSYVEEGRRKAILLAAGGDIEAGTSVVPSPYTEPLSIFEAYLRGMGIKLRPQDIIANSFLEQFRYEAELKTLRNRQLEINTEDFRADMPREERTKLDAQLAVKIVELNLQHGEYVKLLDKYKYKFKVLKKRVDLPENESLLEMLIRRNRGLPEPEKNRLSLVTGGLVKGTADVPHTQENPAERINPITGEPYLEEKEGLLTVLQHRKEKLLTVNTGGSIRSKNRLKYAQGTSNLEDTILRLLKDHNLKPEAISGIMGNIAVESYSVTKKTRYDFQQAQGDDSKKNTLEKGIGYGLFQLDGTKKKLYNTWLKKTNQTDSAKSQIDFMIDTIYGKEQDEIGRTNAGRLRNSFANDDAETIATKFMEIWEKPGATDPQLNTRKQIASDLFNNKFLHEIEVSPIDYKGEGRPDILSNKALIRTPPKIELEEVD